MQFLLKHLYKWLALFLLLLVVGSTSAQQVVVLSKVLDGSKSELATNTFINVQDVGFLNTDASKVDAQYTVRNYINFHINEYSTQLLPDSFTAMIKVRITYQRTDKSYDSLEQTLVINYTDTATYQSRNSFVFNNSHDVTVRVLGLSITRESEKVINALVLENEMDVRAVYVLDCTDDAVKSIYYDTATANTDSTDEITVRWTPASSADEYDLEWTYVDSTALAAGKYGPKENPDPLLIFKHNSSRVTLPGYNYNIPLLFEGPGVLFYRVRAVQVLDNEARRETEWSSAFANPLTGFTFVGHQNALNWESEILFSEEGKRNVTVNYSDGSLRSRQIVTKDNTTNTTIVTENLYDYQGREVIKVMPAPTLNTVIKYSANFNQGLNGVPYDKSLYDTLDNPLDFTKASAPAMSAASGANQYYSPDNPKANEGVNKYIPDAGGYAFQETSYTQDATGRISRQSGLGPVFKMGSNHETKYFYGSPSDNDLNVLFGTEAGDRTHYFKNAVQDANGQMVIAYVDMNGRTIATALAGKADSASLDTLESYVEYKVVDTLSRAGSNTIKGSVLESTKGLLITLEGSQYSQTFRYALQPPVWKKPDCNGDTVCYNGLYDLEIIITDEVNNYNLGGKPFDTIIHNYNADAIITNCNKPDSMVVFFTLKLPKGSYQVTKRLTVSSAALNYYRDSIYMKRNVCTTLADFINKQRTLVATVDCKPTCAGCLASIGEWSTFKANYIANGGDSTAALTAYNEAVAACDELCGTTSPVTEKLDMMLADLTAPSGQYATLSDSIYAYSIFYHKGDNVQPTYMKSDLVYLDEYGRVDSVYEESQGTYVRPQQLSAEAFAAKFKPSWAKALLPYHPEYCRYLVYASYEKALLWDRQFEACETYAAALDSGYLNPIGNTNFPFKTVTRNVDPLASTSSLYDKLSNYTGGSGSNALSMYSVATIIMKCEDATAECAATYNTAASAFDASILCTGDLDMAWRTFRTLYLAYKDHVIDSLVMKAKCKLTTSQLIATSKNPQFTDQTDAFSMAGISYITSGNSAVKDSVNADTKASYEANCNSYINEWIRQLSACIAYDTADLRANVIPQLKAICLEGSDETHLLGSSSTPSGNNSFTAVMAAYNKSKGIKDTLSCNALLITAPGSYDKQLAYSDVVTYSKPSECECEKLRVLREEYAAYKKSSDSSMAIYLNRTHGTSLTESQVELLLESCDTTKSNCTYMASALTIPPLIQCNVAPACISCQEMTSLYASYQATYPGFEPAYEETDSVQQKKNQLFAAYMNNATGYSYQAWQYIAFRDTCKLYNSKDSSICTPANSATSIQTYTNGKKTLFYDLINTPDGGMLLAGQITNESATNPTDAYLVKTTAKGGVKWAKSYSGANGLDYINKIRPTNDGGCILIGTTEYSKSGSNKNSTLVIKIDSTGSITWSKALFLGYNLTGQDIIQTADSGYALSIRYNTSDKIECVLVGLKSTGAPKWGRILSLLSKQANEGFSLAQNGDSLVVAGCSSANLFGGTIFNMWIAKLNISTGVLFKTNFYAKKRESSAEGNYSAQLYKTSYGYLFNMTATNPVTTARTDSNIVVGINDAGKVLFAKQLSNPFDVNATQWMPIVPTSDGGIMTIQNFGTSPAQAVWQKLDENRTVAWSELVNTDSATDLHSIIQRTDGSFAAVGNYGNVGLLMTTKAAAKIGCNDSLFVNASSDIQMDANYTASWGRNDDIITSVEPNTFDISPVVTDLTSSIIHGSISCTYASCYTLHDGPLLCGNATGVFPTVSLDSTNSCTDAENYAVMSGTEQYNAYIDSLSTTFGNDYLDTAIAGGQREVFTLTYTNSEYHYTLYYYDRAGNLIKTVPPAGVVIDRSDAWANKVKVARANNTLLVPAHTMATQYRYNTLNLLVSKKTPDEGITNYWYDRLGKVALTQNSKQTKENRYSYTRYDALGRITETGEITSTTGMTDLISRDTSQLTNWMAAASATRKQITATSYDTIYKLLPSEYLIPENIRNRVSWIALFDDAAAQDVMGFAMATFYSYDIHGNVKALLHDYKQGTLGRFSNRWKKIQYKYDLISGKVNWVGYQPNQKDAFYHRYTYDALNRLTNVEISHDSIFWENDAYYQYYKHGSLARTVIGQQQVQGMDYAYTLEGWLKGINSTAVTSAFDMGGDGASGSQVAKDVFGYSNHYYGSKDYKPVSSSVTPFAGGVSIKPVYNGNIAAISQNTPSLGTALEYTYSYDVLNRLKGMTANRGLDTLTNSWTSTFTPLSDFQEKISYDENGNILRYKRNGNNTFAGSPLVMDSMTYNYQPGTNRLTYIRDTVNESRYGNDIDNQGYDNYKYDSIGHIVSDSRSGIDSIKWNILGKVAKVYKHDSTAIIYTYDGAGNRISKGVISKTNDTTQTWYVRDATGNVLSVYTYNDATVNKGQLSQTEVDLYGSNRLGMTTLATNVQDQTTATVTGMTGLGYGRNVIFIRGKKFFELTNHLGNVQAVVSDRKLGVSLNNSTVDHYIAVIVNAQDYYPFGMLMPGRGGQIGTGKNIASNITRDGETVPATLVLSQRANNTPATYMATESISFEDGFVSGTGDEFTTLIVDPSNNSNSDNGVSYGIIVKGYRYGFNRQERSDEIAGEGNHNTAEFWEYDPRIGRRWNVDPKPNISFSPYSVLEGNPIWRYDILGDTGQVVFLEPEWRYKEVYDVDKDYAKQNPLFAKTIRYKGVDFTILFFHYEPDKKKQDKNRDRTRKANGNIRGSKKDKTDAHEVAYASTKEGSGTYLGLPSNNIMRIIGQADNGSHGGALGAAYRNSGISDGDPIYVILIPGNNQKTQPEPPPLSVILSKSNSNNNNKGNKTPAKVINMTEREVKDNVNKT
ncbi:RHS repeat domain-containing protein, partial [Chitinophaga sancti]|uniref:RHS repeat domain-containing protein n=1 Tax=Chitinophaga sancti TaxID=1004 RepID=UPI003F7B089D